MPRSLSLGARVLLTFIRKRSGEKGRCWWKQSNIAKTFKRDLRTVNRWVAELVSNGSLVSERHGHFNHYILKEIVLKMSYRVEKMEVKVENSVQSGEKQQRSVVSDTTKMSYRNPVQPITEIKVPERGEPSGVVEITPGRMAFNEAFEHHVKTSEGWDSLPRELVDKICARAGTATPTQAAAVFLEVFWRAHQRNDIRDGMGFLLAVFSQEIAKVAPPVPHKPPQRAEAYEEVTAASIARLAARKRL